MWSSMFLWNIVITRLYGVITHSVTAVQWKLQIFFWITQPVSFLFVMWQAVMYCDCIELIHVHGKSLVSHAHLIQQHYIHQPWDFFSWPQRYFLFPPFIFEAVVHAWNVGISAHIVPVACSHVTGSYLQLDISYLQKRNFKNVCQAVH